MFRGRARTDQRIERLCRSEAPWPRFFEAGPALGLALLVFWKAHAFAAVWPCYGYLGYLLLDLLVLPQRRFSKRLRNASSAIFTLAYLGWALPRLGLPRPAGAAALAAVLAGAGLPYLHEKGRTGVAFVRGLVAAALLELGALALAPSALGAELALPLYAAAFAWEERSVLWRVTAPSLAAYALVVPVWLGGRAELLPHAIAGLAAWMVVRFLGHGAGAETEEAPSAGTGTTLGLRD